ncbi:hypothetical protein At1D1460_46130 [Agrobacterium tumefaciens]|nr:hypothetical protein At1D1460_46130 [Agrobacterium tumefaciens]
MAVLQPYFPKSHSRQCVDDRRVLSGIIFVNRNGLQLDHFGAGRFVLTPTAAVFGVERLRLILKFPAGSVSNLMAGS